MEGNEILEIRKDTLSLKRVQDNNDVLKVADVQNRLRHCKSLLDIIDCRKFPALKTTKIGSSNSKGPSKRLLGVPFTYLSYLKIDPQCGSDACYIATDLVACVTFIKPPTLISSIGSRSSKRKNANANEISDNKSCDSSLSSKGPFLSSLKLKGKGKQQQQQLLRSTMDLKNMELLNSIKRVSTVDSAAADTRSQGSFSVGDESNSSIKLCTAFDTLKEAPRVLDPARCYFHAALLFDDVNMHDRAVQCYKKAIRPSSPEAVVDNYRMKETPAALHKLKTMCRTQQLTYLSDRAILRVKLIEEEERRNRLKVLVSYIQLTRLYMILGDFPAAHSSLCSSVELCESRKEHRLTLVYFHTLLSEMASCVGSDEFTLEQTILRESAGPLAEIHIWILQDLLKENVIPHDLLFEWLGKRFTETGDLIAAKQYFKTTRDLRDGFDIDANLSSSLRVTHSSIATPSDSVRDAFDTGNILIKADTAHFSANRRDFLAEYNRQGVDIAGNLRRKCALTAHHSEEGRVTDVLTAKNRVDYSRPDRAHHSASTIIYISPLLGWEKTLEAKIT